MRARTVGIAVCALFLMAAPSVFAVQTADAQTFRAANQRPGDCGGLVPCGCDTNNNERIDENEQCGFNDLLLLIQNLLDWIVLISIPISAVMFAYAGWLYMSAQGDKNKIQSAHTVFVNVTIGFMLVLGAWVIVYSIASAVLETRFLDFLNI